MLIKKYDFEDKQQFKLVVLGDLHLGDGLCDLQLIKMAVNYIKDTPDCYAIVNGDIMNNAIPGSKSDQIGEVLTMEEQQDLAVELLFPIKEKIIMFAPGNHENRSYRLTGINPLRYVAKVLGLTDRYASEAYIIDIKTRYKGENKQASHYKIYGMHGAYGGGRKVGSAANALQEMSAVVANANLYVRSHTHNHISFNDDVYMLSDRGNLVRVRRTYYNANAFLKYGGYAEDKGYRLTDVQPAVINVTIYNGKDANGKSEVYFKTDIIKI